MVASSLYLVVIQFLSVFVAFLAVASGKTMYRPHRYHNRIFHPNERQDPHRTRRDDDCQDDEWESMTFAGRVANGDSDGILQGLVLRLINARNPLQPYTGKGLYTAEVRVDCLYRGWGYGAVVNISGFGETNDCVETHVSDGKSYIFLVQTDWYGYAVREYNQQSAAVEVTSRSENEVKSFYSCRDPSETSAMSYGSDFSQYFSDFSQQSSVDSTHGRSDFFTNFESFKDLCPIYELYSSDEEYYDYDRDGLLDYCRFNIGTSINNINFVLIILLNAISILLGYSTRLS